MQRDDERERLLGSERAALAEAVGAHERFRDLVNSVDGIVWEAEVPSFRFSFVSKQAERILGYPVEQWLSEPTCWSDHLHADDRDARAGNELTITSEAATDHLMISISDTGAGLPPDHGDKIFNAFFTTKDDGTGMGLPISRSIIESHGGRLWATDRAGRGATLQFKLPAAAAVPV